MAMLQQIRHWSYRRKLQERKTRLHTSRPSTHNPGDKIGILYQSNTNDDILVVRRLKQELKNYGMMVKTLAYIDEKTDVSTLAQKAFSRNEVKWNGVPESDVVDEFLTWKFDLLICPILDMKTCLSYIIDLSPADLKIGYQAPEAEKLYDIIIDGDRNKQLNDILADIFQHLKILAH